MVRVVHVSDTHNRLGEMKHLIPHGDVLIHSGDATDNGRQSEYHKFMEDLSELPHAIKLYTPGNHDRGLDSWTRE